MSLEDIEKRFYSFPVEEKKEKPEEKKEDQGVKSQDAPVYPSGEQSETTKNEKKQPASSGWAPETQSKSKLSKFFPIIAISVFVILGTVAGIFVFSKFFGGETQVNASVDIYAPAQMYRGVPFEASIEVRNDEDFTLKGGELTISLSSGLAPSGGKLRIEEEIGEIEPGEKFEKKIPVFAVGEVGSVQKINIEFLYDLNGGKKEIKDEHEVFIKESGIRLLVERSQIPSENSKFEIKITYENVSAVDFADSSIEVMYPNLFVFSSSDPVPFKGKGVWSLGSVKSKSGGKITIYGTVSKNESSPLKLPVVFKTKVEGEEFILAEESVILTATPYPILMSLLVGGKEDYIASINSGVSYMLKVRNNSGISLSDVVVVTKLEGEVFDFSTISTKGTFSSVDNTIRWNAAQIPKLRTLGPEESIELSFSTRLLEDFPIKTPSDKNFILKNTIETTSPTIPHGSTADKTYVRVMFENKVMGKIEIDAKAWRDDPWGIINTGVLPLRVDTPTQYTIHWTVKNYSTDVRDVLVRSALEPNVKFTGIVKTNAPTSPVINERTNIVEWKIPFIDAGRGVINKPYEVVFQVEATPSIAQTGRALKLLQETTIEALDTFTGLIIKDKDDEVDAKIQHDPTFKDGDHVINK